MLSKNDLKIILQYEADNYGVNAKILFAIAEVESSGFNPKAVRYEKNWHYYHKDQEFAKVQRITLETERTLQKMSFGFMQVMGGTARWLGFSGALFDLLIPSINAKYATMFFERLQKKYRDVNDQIAAYNSGSVGRNQDGHYKNQSYVDKVLQALHSQT